MRSGKELPDSERSNHSTRQIGHSASEAFSVRFARPNFTSVLDVFGVTGLATAQGRCADRPTVIYTPLTGGDFLQKLMTPIPPSAVLFVLQAG